MINDGDSKLFPKISGEASLLIFVYGILTDSVHISLGVNNNCGTNVNVFFLCSRFSQMIYVSHPIQQRHQAGFTNDQLQILRNEGN